ncbi:MAG: thiol-disulfide oxidoreductase DCC family protein [Bacteriovoracaceae bacterium]
MKYHLPVILYDSECPLCLRFKQGLEHLDRNLNFVSARDEQIYLEFPELSRELCLEKVHLITKDRTILSGPEVVDYLIHNLPGVSKLAWLLDNDQGQKVKNFFYQKVEELRELTTKKDSDCQQCPRK